MTDFKDAIKFDDFAKIDLRVATIREAEFHPNADRLFKMQLDDGTEEGRQICAGIRGYYEPEDLVGKQVVIVANLEPRKIRGEISNGMIIAGSCITNPDAEPEEQTRNVVVLTPMSDSLPAGSPVS